MGKPVQLGTGPHAKVPAMLDLIQRPSALFFIILFVALLPLMLYPLGISGDYPNHLARVYITAELSGSTALQEHFTFAFGIYPDLAMDIFVPPMMSFMDPYTAGAVFNLIAAAMLPIGVALLSWALGGRVGLPVIASVLLIYSKPLAWGFINFVFAAGLALCLLALWVFMRPGWLRTGVFALLMPVIFFSHVLGFLLFGYLMLAYEIGRYFAQERGSILAFLRGLVLRDGLIALVPLVLFAASLPQRLAGLEVQISGFGGFASRGEALTAPFDFDNSLLALFVLTGLYAALYFAYRRKWLVLAREMVPVFIASVILVLATPAAFSGIALLHIRFGMIPAAILLAGSFISEDHKARVIAVFAILAGVFAFQQVIVHQRVAFLHQNQSEIRRAVAELPTGARVLIGADAINAFVFRLNHAPSFAVIEVDGYVPNLFTNTSPVAVSASALPLHRPQAWPLSRNLLERGAQLDPPTVRSADGIQRDYYHGWPTTFDALLWFTTSEGTPLESDNLTLISASEGFRLYAITRGSD